jgi:hypothetical protein
MEYNAQSILTIVMIVLALFSLFYIHRTNESVTYIRKSLSTTSAVQYAASERGTITEPTTHSDGPNLKIIEGTSGHLFLGEKVASFDGKVLFRELNDQKIEELYRTSRSLPLTAPHNLTCTFWAVVTTINPPTEAVEKQISLPSLLLEIK